MPQMLTKIKKDIKDPLDGALRTSNALLEAYQNRQFEYIAYKDFQKMLQSLKEINTDLKHCQQGIDALVKEYQRPLHA